MAWRGVETGLGGVGFQDEWDRKMIRRQVTTVKMMIEPKACPLMLIGKKHVEKL